MYDLDLIVLYQASDSASLVADLCVRLSTLGARWCETEEQLSAAPRDLLEQITCAAQRSAYVAVVVGLHFTQESWPAVDARVLTLLQDRVIFVRHDVPPGIRRTLATLLADLEWTDSENPDELARYLVSIFQADSTTQYHSAVPGVGEREMVSRLISYFVRDAIGRLTPEERALVEEQPGDTGWIDWTAQLFDVSQAWVRFTRETLSFMSDEDAEVVLTERLLERIPGLARRSTRANEVLRRMEEHFDRERADDRVRDVEGGGTVASDSSPETERGWTPTGGEKRRVRIFISSTFRDMHAERDLLTKLVFPELRDRCQMAGISLAEVDLRWGVTEEDVNSGTLLPRCLNEIEHCRPYFVALLGERYGWVPPHIDDAVIAKWGWLRTMAERSITEIEIRHGALGHGDAAPENRRALVYIRRPEYTAAVPSSERSDYSAENHHAAEHLATLKREISSSGVTTREYDRPELFAHYVLEDLRRLLEPELGAQSISDILEFDTQQQDRFAERVSSSTVRRRRYERVLTASVEGQRPAVALVAKSGTGKSTVLANWVRHSRVVNPDTTIIWHSSEAWRLSADVTAMLSDVMGQLKRRLAMPDELKIPIEDHAALLSTFNDWLRRAAERGPFTLVLDGLDRLGGHDGAQELDWLPNELPATCRLIVSTTPGRVAAALQGRGVRVISLRGFTRSERTHVIERTLAYFGKRLAPEHRELFLSARQTTHPRFLAVLLEELRLFGSHEGLSERIRWYLTAANVTELYERILARLEADYERYHPGLLRDALTLLWAAPEGLPELTLREMLGTATSAVPRAIWEPVRIALREAIHTRLSLLFLANADVKEAVRRRYLTVDGAAQAVHRRLALHYLAQSADRADWRLVLYHLAAGHMWSELANLLSSPAVFSSTRQHGPNDVLRYWRQIEEATAIRMLDTYRPLLAHIGELDAVHRMELMHLLLTAGHKEAVMTALEPFSSPMPPIGADSLDNLRHVQSPFLRGQALLKFGHFVEAAVEFAEAARECREANDNESLVLALMAEAEALDSAGDRDGALRALDEAEQTARRGAMQRHLADVLRRQVELLRASNHLEAAERVEIEAAFLERELE